MTATTRVAHPSPGASPPVGRGLQLTWLWQVIVGLAGLGAIVFIWRIEPDIRLSTVVQSFLTVVVGVFALAALASAVLMGRGSNIGRIIGMFVNLVGTILGVLVLLHFLGIYIGFDYLAAGIFQHVGWLLGIAAGYAIMWLGWRFPDGSSARFYVERLGIGVILLSIILLSILAGLPTALVTIGAAWLRWEPLVITVVILVFGVATRFLFRQGEHFGETVAQREAWQGWLFLLPNFISFMIFFALPLLLSFYLSFTDYGETSLKTAEFVGLRNYANIFSVQFTTLDDPGQPVNEVLYPAYTEVFRLPLGDTVLVMGARDPLFWLSLSTTIRYCILLLILSIVPALALALVLNSKIPGMKFFRAVYFLPSIAAVVGVALIWQWLYNPVIGFINYAIQGVWDFFNRFAGGTLTAPEPQWLTDESLLLIATVIMAAWQIVGFNTVIFLAGLQGVNKEVMEAATVDGANAWTRFRRVLLPLIAPTTFFVTVTTLITGLQAFTEFFILLGNSTSNARLTTVFLLYQQGFRDIRFGYASTTAWVLFGVIFVVTLIQFRLSSRAEAYSD